MLSGHDASVAQRYLAIAHATNGAGDLDAAIADLYRLPVDLPFRGALAAGLIGALVRASPYAGPASLRHLDALLEIADRDPPPAPKWPRLRAATRALALMRAAADDELADPAAALAELDTLATGAGDDPAMVMLLDSARGGARYLKALNEGDEAALRELPMNVENLRKLADLHPAIGPVADLVAECWATMAANRRGEDIWDALPRIRQAADWLPHDQYLRAYLDDWLAIVAPLQQVCDIGPDGRATMPTDDQVKALAALARRTDSSPADRAVRWAAAAGAVLGGGLETDPHRVDLAIEYFRAALDSSPLDDPQRPFHLQGLALGLFRRSELTNTVADLDEATTLLRAAREVAGGPHHPQWIFINDMLAKFSRRRGVGTDDPSATLLDGLRGHVWRVLLQSDLTAGNIAARSAATDAVDAARFCLTNNELANAIRALDSGRALVLFAATGLRDAASQLAESQSDLARRWRAASASGNPADLPTDLRGEVLTALAGQGSATGLLDPPALDEIREALDVLDADALVYLVPGTRPTPGLAVIAPVTGPPSYLALPDLVIDSGLDVERYLDVLTSRDAALAGPARDLAPQAGSAFHERLDRLCDWAWRVAIGPLVERYLPTLPGSPSGRPPRVVLVPMGDLARVPWQAARRPADGRYAIEMAAFSQAASARLLCHTSKLVPVRPAPAGLVVGDPDTRGAASALGAARTEAYAIHGSFYRGGRYIGRRPDGSTSPSGAGTADEVRDWLTRASPAAGGMLHLACHGVIAAGESAPGSYLLLAGGGLLAAMEVAELMTRSTRRPIGLVVLAACRTGQAISGYDEAYSLGTAFLAGGARSVLSTQWSIPDRATSVLMYMFHHYLMVERLPAWAALRQAQLWMLNPHRELPERMPAPLRAHLTGADLADVVAWAGFIHWGQ
jgi:tetratricopeptide (TPR) repeat protein